MHPIELLAFSARSSTSPATSTVDFTCSLSSNQETTAFPSDKDTTDPLRPYPCRLPGCSLRFKRSNALNDHMNAHTGERPFRCPVRSCGRGFTTSGNLARHERTHPWLGVPLKCLIDGCPCEFSSEAKLERHMKSHLEGSDEVRCTILSCGKVFSTPGNLRRHIKVAHNDFRPRGSRRRPSSSPAPTHDQAHAFKVSVGCPGDWTSASASIDPIALEPLPCDRDMCATLQWLFSDDDATEFVSF